MQTLIVLATLTAVAAGQCATNTNNNCQLGALPQDGTTVYYAPSDTGDIEFFGQGQGTCDSGSSADVQLYSTYQDSSPSNLIADCGCLPLDGNTYVLDCPGVNKGSIPEGGYHFVIGLNANYAGLDRFSITHTEQTSTAPTPTSTVTATTYESTVVTTTSTETDTTTLAQVTVTTPGTTATNVATIAPSLITSTTTLTKTYTRYALGLTVVQTTVTKTLPCKTVIPPPCPTSKKRLMHARDVVQGANGYTVTGDGPLTTTVTPNGVVVTTTIDGGTTTNTETAYTTVTTTVLPSPPTTTVPGGPTTSLTTVTLATPTSLVTKHASTRTTVTYTLTFTWAHTKSVTPVCTK